MADTSWSITNGFGAAAPEGVTYKQGYHTGTDYNTTGSGNVITPFYAGTVEKIGNDPDGWGNYIWIKDIFGNHNLYAHLADGELGVAEGDQVDTSTPLGIAGSTGQATGTHLHFEIRSDRADAGTAIDPLTYAAAVGNVDDNLFFGISKTSFIRAALIVAAVVLIYLSIKKIIMG